jgi:hypothetical protein
MDAKGESFESALRALSVTQARLDALVLDLTKKTMVVSDASLQHLVDQGVLARLARAGCCKPDGGTCCPNKKIGMPLQQG